MSKKIKIVITFTVIIVVYFASYLISMYKFNKDENPRMTIKTQQETVKKETKVKLTNRYLKSGEETVKNIPLDQVLIGKDMNYVRNYFKNKYTVINISSDEISLYIDHDTYSPEKYFIGIANDKLAIFYIDKNLNSTKKEDTEILIDYLQEGDRTSLEEGDIKYQYNTLEEAEEGLSDYS